MKYKKGLDYKENSRSYKTFGIDEYTEEGMLSRENKIEVYNDEILRDRIIQKLNNEKNSPLEGFIKMLIKKAPEYLEQCSVDSISQNVLNSEREVATNELKSFTSWLISQTGEYKRIQAERKEYLSKADEKDQEMKKYTEERWF